MSTQYNIREYILDAIFPKKCLGCKKFDTWLCNDCQKNLPLRTEQQCPICTSVVTPEGTTCLSCLRSGQTDLDGVFVASIYSDPLLKKIIHAYKYRFLRDLSEPLALLLAQSLQNSHMQAPDIIMSVPLHPRRLRWRGFNQSHLLAQDLDLTIPLKTDVLVRSRFTKSQAKKAKKSHRINNLKNAFHVKDSNEVRQKNILLVDDIVTTTTTLQECAKALKKSDAKTVSGLVLARE